MLHEYSATARLTRMVCPAAKALGYLRPKARNPPLAWVATASGTPAQVANTVLADPRTTISGLRTLLPQGYGSKNNDDNDENRNQSPGIDGLLGRTGHPYHP